MVLCVSLPYRPHSEYPSPYGWSTTPVKRRPSAAWFAVGAVLMVVAGIVFGVAIVRFVRDIADADAVFSASGVHEVTLPANAERALFVPDGRPIPRCQVSSAGGQLVQFRRPAEDFSYGDWVAVRVFDTGDGHLTFSCPLGGRGEIRIAEIPSEGDFARLGFLGVMFPLALGGAGFVVLLVTTILWFSRRPTSQIAGMPPGWPPGPQPGWQQGPPPGGPPAGPSSGIPPAHGSAPGPVQGPGQREVPPAPSPDQPGGRQPPGTPGWPPSP
jgi:hypothetical protein